MCITDGLVFGRTDEQRNIIANKKPSAKIFNTATVPKRKVISNQLNFLLILILIFLPEEKCPTNSPAGSEYECQR